jgi:hypothetical protein
MNKKKLYQRSCMNKKRPIPEFVDELKLLQRLWMNIKRTMTEVMDE